MGTMFDTTSDFGATLSGLPVEAVAAYGNGRFANFTRAKQAFPNAHILQIDVSGQGIGDAGDFEPGDMRYSRAGSWAKQRIEAGVKRPVIYFSVSNWQAVMASLREAGVSRNAVRLWTAHYNGRAHLCSSACGFGVTGTADATQWGSADARGTLPSRYAGRNIDVSTTADDFWDGATSSRGHAAHAAALRRGDRGHRVEQLTRRLSFVPSHAGRAYLDGTRHTIDAETVKALKQFQAEHHLHVDGVFGRESRRALDRAVRHEKARRRHKTRPAPPAGRPRNLADVVMLYRRRDALSDQAWKQLAAYGARYRAALAHVEEQTDGEVTLADIAAILGRIEHGVQALVDRPQESHAAPSPVATLPAPVAPAATTSGATAALAPAAVAHAPAVLDDLPDAELAQLVVRLDHELDDAREALIARYLQAARLIARAKRRQPQAPALTPRPGVLVTQRPPTGPGTERPHVQPPQAKPHGGEHSAPQHSSVSARNVQVALNAFTRRYLKGFAPLVTDGKVGPATKQRIRAVKYYLGYAGAARKSTTVDAKLISRMRAPHSARHSNPALLARASRRRRQQRKHAKRSQAPRAGVATFDGRPVAAWMKPYLTWARKHGWHGTLSSGWRSPEHSEHVCRQKCGAAKCAGTCAGRSSNHVGRVRGQGAIDVTHPAEFARLMRTCPYTPRIFNDLPADPVHFSATGH